MKNIIISFKTFTLLIVDSQFLKKLLELRIDEKFDTDFQEVNFGSPLYKWQR